MKKLGLPLVVFAGVGLAMAAPLYVRGAPPVSVAAPARQRLADEAAPKKQREGEPPPRRPGPNADVLSGVLRDESGRPLAGQQLSIVFSWARHSEGHQRATTDAEGRFRFTTRGSVNVRVDRAGYELIHRVVEVDSIEGTQIEVVVRAVVPLSGRVQGGQAVAGGYLRALPVPPAGANLEDYLYRTGRVDSAGIDPDGRFAFKRIGAGEYLLDVKPKGALPFTARVRAPDANVLLTAGVGGRLTGVVKDAKGAPVAGAQIHVREVTARVLRGFSEFSQTDAEGRIDVAGLPDMELDVEATPPPPAPKGSINLGGPLCAWKRVRMSGTSSQPVELVLGGGGKIRGVVFDAAGKSVSGAEVFGMGDKGLCDARMATSGADGSFELASVNSGRYRLWASTGERKSMVKSEEVQASAGDGQVRLVMPAAKK